MWFYLVISCQINSTNGSLCCSGLCTSECGIGDCQLKAQLVEVTLLLPRRAQIYSMVYYLFRAFYTQLLYVNIYVTTHRNLYISASAFALLKSKDCSLSVQPVQVRSCGRQVPTEVIVDRTIWKDMLYLLYYVIVMRPQADMLFSDHFSCTSITTPAVSRFLVRYHSNFHWSRRSTLPSRTWTYCQPSQNWAIVE